MRFASAAIIVALAMPFAAFADEGIVLDNTRGNPIPGAVIVRIWTGFVPLPVQSHLQCYHLGVATADAQGRFTMSSFSFTFHPFLLDRRSYILTAYKPGYRFVSAREASGVLMEPLPGDRAKRLRQIVGMSIPLDCPIDDVKTLIEPILRPAYREAMALVETRDEWDRADGLLSAIERLELGPEPAHTRAVARRVHWRETIVQHRANPASDDVHDGAVGAAK